MTAALGIGAFGAGVWLLVESVEGLVATLRAWALAAGLSGLVLGALVLGADLESTAAGVAATLNGLPGAALGSSVGAAIFLLTVGLGAAALVAPFAVRVPGRLLAAGALAVALPAALGADGRFSRLDGALLLGAFVPLVALFARARPAAAGRSDGARRPDRLALRLLAALAGLLVGAQLLILGTRTIVDALGLSETLFGLLAVAAAVSFEEVVLEALPAYRGFPELSVGNALGTLVFLLTGSLGVIALVRPLRVADSVRLYHLPALVLAAALAGALLARGRLGRRQGALLIGAYVLYAAGALLT